MEISIDYGKTGLPVTLPSDTDPVVLRIGFTPGPVDQVGLVAQALHNPIGSKPLSGIARPSDTVGIVFSDITRATPYDVILPPLLAELAEAGIADNRIFFFNATGTHRSNTTDELITILGKEVVSRFQIFQNDCQDDSSHRVVGTTRSGNRIELLTRFLDCDIRIPTGFIEPHFFAGMSGGGKAIMPGLASLRTVQRNHSAAHMDHTAVRWGITEGNPLWEEVREAALMAGPSFILNVAMNRDKEVTAVFAGDFLEAHKQGCEYVRANAMVPVSEAFDVVVTGNSGYPLDLNLYQSVKGMSAAAQIVKQGGHIVMAADCWDGIPEHGGYGQLLAGAASPEDLLRTIRSPGFAAADMWQAQLHARICQRATVHFYSENLSDAQLRSAFLEPCHDIGDLIRTLVAELGPSIRICVLPEGPLTIPYVQTSARDQITP